MVVDIDSGEVRQRRGPHGHTEVGHRRFDGGTIHTIGTQVNGAAHQTAQLTRYIKSGPVIDHDWDLFYSPRKGDSGCQRLIGSLCGADNL